MRCNKRKTEHLKRLAVWFRRVSCPPITHLAFFSGPLQNPLLDGSFANQSVDGHLFCLAQSMSPIHGLLIDSGIPVRVVEDNLMIMRQYIKI